MPSDLTISFKAPAEVKGLSSHSFLSKGTQYLVSSKGSGSKTPSHDVPVKGLSKSSVKALLDTVTEVECSSPTKIPPVVELTVSVDADVGETWNNQKRQPGPLSASLHSTQGSTKRRGSVVSLDDFSSAKKKKKKSGKKNSHCADVSNKMEHREGQNDNLSTSLNNSEVSTTSSLQSKSWHPPNYDNPAVDQICITDVTSNLLTVTITECKTWHGFFRERSQLSSQESVIDKKNENT